MRNLKFGIKIIFKKFGYEESILNKVVIGKIM